MVKTPESNLNISTKNSAKPIYLENLEFIGVSAKSARKGEKTEIWVRHYLSSDEKSFHGIAKNFIDLLYSKAIQCNQNIDFKNAITILLVIHSDNTGDLWVDSVAVSMKILSKRSFQAGSDVSENDIADIISVSFPDIKIEKEDRVVYLFRDRWRFGLFFDFNHEGNFSITDMERDLATLFRRMRFADIYDALDDDNILERIIKSGWFPFAEFSRDEFKQLVEFDLPDPMFKHAEEKIFTAFDVDRLDKMYSRWIEKPHFAGKKQLLHSAISSFHSKNFIAAIKIIQTEIEGIISDYHYNVHGKRERTNKLIKSVINSAEEKAGQRGTLLFPEIFEDYLKSNTFFNFNPYGKTGRANSRHAVAHGRAESDTYTQVVALQALLTLDQIAFYT